jgi:predicted DNA-binding protein (UPF0251 family)
MKNELSVAEIARLLDISEGTVHSRLYTARERLRAMLKAGTSTDVPSNRCDSPTGLNRIP